MDGLSSGVSHILVNAVFRPESLNGSWNGKLPVGPALTPSVNVRLTRRELEVLRSLARGYTTRAIANELNISSTTVKNHIKHVLAKFGAHTRLEAIRCAETAGLI